MSRIIALSGWKRSGKSTVAEYLSNMWGFTELSFAEYLKEKTAEQYGLPPACMYDQELKEAPLRQYPVIPTDSFTVEIHKLLSNELQSGYWTPRALLILEGSVKRAVHANYWVRQVTEIIRMNPWKNYVITDMRYKSEADTLKLLFPEELVTLRINRFNSIGTTDPSERDLDDYKFSFTLNNIGSTEELYSQVTDILITLAQQGK